MLIKCPGQAVLLFITKPRVPFHWVHQGLPFFPPQVFFKEWMEFNKCTYREGDGWQEFLSAVLMRVIGYTTSYIFSKDTMRILRKPRKSVGRRSSASFSPAVSNLSSTRILIKPRSKTRTSRLLHKLILTSAAITMAAALTQPRPRRLEGHPQLSDSHIITTEKGRAKGASFPAPYHWGDVW